MKTSRRQFVTKTVSLLALPQITSLVNATQKPDGENYRLIDCQSHLFCPELVDLMKKRKT